jgi:hypothetical protein
LSRKEGRKMQKHDDQASALCRTFIDQTIGGEPIGIPGTRRKQIVPSKCVTIEAAEADAGTGGQGRCEPETYEDGGYA